jgi:hypothetical protein
MPLDKANPDSFIPDDAQTPQERRKYLNQRINLNWAAEDIQEIDRMVKGGQEGWAMWRRQGGNS